MAEATEAKMIEERERRAKLEAEELPKSNGGRYPNETLFIEIQDAETDTIIPQPLPETDKSEAKPEKDSEAETVEKAEDSKMAEGVSEMEETLPFKRRK